MQMEKIALSSILLSVFCVDGYQDQAKNAVSVSRISTEESGYGEKFQMMPRLAARARALMGAAADNVWEHGFTKEQRDNWFKSLNELGKYVTDKSKGASSSNIGLFNLALENLKRWSGELFNAVQVAHNTKTKSPVQHEIVKKIEKEIADFKLKLSPKWSDYQKTKEIKQTLQEVVGVLEGINEKAVSGF